MLCIELLSYKCHFCSDFMKRGLIFVNMKLVFLLLIAVQLEIAVTCPLNCICEETETTCTFESCTDEISLDYTDFLIVIGKLCPEQRNVLRTLTPNTIIVLKSDTCKGIRNCR